MFLQLPCLRPNESGGTWRRVRQPDSPLLPRPQDQPTATLRFVIWRYWGRGVPRGAKWAREPAAALRRPRIGKPSAGYPSGSVEADPLGSFSIPSRTRRTRVGRYTAFLFWQIRRREGGRGGHFPRVGLWERQAGIRSCQRGRERRAQVENWLPALDAWRTVRIEPPRSASY